MIRTTKYRAVAQNLTTGRRLLILPRSKKTALFTDIALAERALDRFSRRIGNGWRDRKSVV